MLPEQIASLSLLAPVPGYTRPTSLFHNMFFYAHFYFPVSREVSHISEHNCEAQLSPDLVLGTEHEELW